VLPLALPPLQLLDDLISASLDFYGAKGELQSEPPVPVSLERAKDQRLVRTPLKYPGRLPRIWPTTASSSATPTTTAS